MENQLPQNNSNNKKLLPLVAIVGTILIIGAVAFLFLNRNKQTVNQTPEESSLSIPQESIGGVNKFEAEDVTFSTPPGYKVKEREKGLYVIISESGTQGGSEITVDTRRAEGINSDYDVAIENAKTNRTELTEKEITGGIKMYGLIKEGPEQGTPSLNVYLKYGDGAIAVETLGQNMNEATFDLIANSIKIN